MGEPSPFTPEQEARIRDLIAEAHLVRAQAGLARMHQVLELFRRPPPLIPAKSSDERGP